MSNNTNATPQFRILKRPKDAGDSQLNGNGRQKKPQAPQKTLAQREEEYAQARLRIMGAAFPEDESDEQSNGPSQPKGANANSVDADKDITDVSKPARNQQQQT